MLNDVNIKKSYIGICPGLVKALPISWLLFLLQMFNVIFFNVCYSVSWCYSKLFVLFKGGRDKLDCGNYRGISIMNTLAKMYDMLLLYRLKLWVSIDKCQAGAQQGRGCIEQIMTLRLLCDYANFKKCKLYVLFIDFSKVYDRVPRGKLIEVLRSLGCGSVMLRALQAMYACTRSVLRSATIDATAGVRQGAPSSCLLFTVYMDQLVRMLRRSVGSDGFLGTLHSLLLMDDIVLLATSRDMCLRKLSVVMDFCHEYGMVLNEKKTKVMVIRGMDRDKEPLILQDVKIDYSSIYSYLGAWFSDDAKVNTILDLHEKSGEAQVNKFAIFCAANANMPFIFKRKVFEAAMTSSLLYSSETWLVVRPRKIIAQYNRSLKCLLGVRKFTSPDLCMVESGIHPAQDVIDKKRHNFLKSKLSTQHEEEPFYLAFKLCETANTPGYKFLSQALRYDTNVNPLDRLRRRIMDKPQNASKFVTYRTQINPGLSVHSVYESKNYIPDYKRQAFTRLRLMSHNLKIETGRRHGIPSELRLCSCTNASVQDESHVLLYCSLSRHYRNEYHMLDFSSMYNLMGSCEHAGYLCEYIYNVMKLYM